jgi:hypothetical protein
VKKYRNTELVRTGKTLEVRLHGNCIIIHRFVEGKISFYSHGWKSYTTKKRINDYCSFMPFRVFQKDFEWFVNAYGGRVIVPFEEGLTLHVTWQRFLEEKLKDVIDERS